jgi:hypothetical protein
MEGYHVSIPRKLYVMNRSRGNNKNNFNCRVLVNVVVRHELSIASGTELNGCELEIVEISVVWELKREFSGTSVLKVTD